VILTYSLTQVNVYFYRHGLKFLFCRKYSVNNDSTFCGAGGDCFKHSCLFTDWVVCLMCKLIQRFEVLPRRLGEQCQLAFVVIYSFSWSAIFWCSNHAHHMFSNDCRTKTIHKYAVQINTRFWYLHFAHGILQVIEYGTKQLGTVTMLSLRLPLLCVIHFTRISWRVWN